MKKAASSAHNLTAERLTCTMLPFCQKIIKWLVFRKWDEIKLLIFTYSSTKFLGESGFCKNTVRNTVLPAQFGASPDMYMVPVVVPTIAHWEKQAVLIKIV